MSVESLGLYDAVVDAAALERTVARFREREIVLPTFAQLADPTTMPAKVTDVLASVGADDADPRNLWRVNWYNDSTREGRSEIPEFIEIPGELTGVDARIVLALGNRFPMIRAHKVLAAYSCLAPRVVAGAFDPTAHRAIWPSTGNYARGGVAISEIMGCRGVAVLPEGMSRERFEWLEDWISDPSDVIRTYGTESNVKEIYDACNELAKDPTNVILNQFAEFSNHLGHYWVTGRALEHVFETVGNGARLAAFVSASGSAGTLGAGDYLKDRYGCRIAAVEALECPTMLYNGYGEHNIQGIGDKHIPLIHNVSNTDDAIAISDEATDTLMLLFNTPVGREHLLGAGIAPEVVDGLRNMGYSSICNMLAAIKMAKYHRMGSDDVIVTVATDGAEMYGSEVGPIIDRDHGGSFDGRAAAAAHARFLEGVDTDQLLELGELGRRRIFNLGYYTWVEQQGIDFELFEARRDRSWWDALRPYTARWDEMIIEFNERTGVTL
ncbi:MAG: pyridoxal-phosphate dependent enzyme [Acidimicrobiia bacterium]|nr:pyridoxal-phosphate dependent enzyme [Acidimicrobiia bacterium]MDH4308815.1 pyridoxal-phosphate dependent enzyme [Acidimicrobiia bacterium]